MQTTKRHFRARHERAVFVADDDRRSRRLRTGVGAASAFALLWAAGLGIGMLGSGHLPGISLQIPGRGSDQPQSNESNEVSRRPPQFIAEGSTALEVAQRGDPAVRRDRAGTGGRAAGSPLNARTVVRGGPPRLTEPPPVGPGQVAQPPAQAASQPVPPGLARRGLTAPPGQERRATGPQPPETQPGQARRPETTTARASPTTTTETLPAGQQKPDKPPPKG